MPIISASNKVSAVKSLGKKFPGCKFIMLPHNTNCLVLRGTDDGTDTNPLMLHWDKSFYYSGKCYPANAPGPVVYYSLVIKKLKYKKRK